MESRWARASWRRAATAGRCRPTEDDAEEPPAAVGWVLVTNDSDALDADLAAIWLTEEAIDAVIVCGGIESVVDEGVGTRAVCD
jgi:hypothetical protein